MPRAPSPIPSPTSTMLTPYADLLLRVLHVLIGAGWLGSVYFSLTVLHPQGREVFEDDARFEEFVTGLSNGNRKRVLSGFAGTFLTGWLLIGLHIHQPHPTWWWGMVWAKTCVFFLALGVFWYVSWRLWPARLFAIPEEFEAFRRKGTILRATSLVLVGVDTILGVLMHALHHTS